MTTFERIQKALEPFGFPCEMDMYYGDKKHYFVYNYTSDAGRLFADNEVIERVAGVQVHLYLPSQENFLKLKNEVRQVLWEEGFTFSDITVMLDENKSIRHIIFECEIEESEE